MNLVFGRSSVIGILLYFLGGTAALAAQDATPSVESTSAYRLLVLEADVRGIPPNADKLFRAVVTDATHAAVREKRRPLTKDSAIRILGAIQVALIKHNFLQPAERKDWPKTLGEAFTPLARSAQEMTAILAYSSNAKRLKHFDDSQPYYFVDCDMGSMLFIAVSERLGWDFRLVEVPDHNFIRWHLPDGTVVNWDWTHGDSLDDAYYSSAISEDVRVRALYLRSFTAAEARAYFLGLVASQATTPEDAERLFLDALTAAPPNPTTLNNVAWLYATKLPFAKDSNKTNLAIRYGLDAWSMKPEDGNIADTVACSFAAAGHKELAKNVEDYAVSHASGPAQAKSFRDNRDRIMAGKLCE